jgi:hypothetical protein
LSSPGTTSMVSCSGWNDHGRRELTPPSNSTHGALAGRGTCAGFATGTAFQAHAEHLLAGDAVQRHQRERQQEHRHRHADQARQPGTA